MSNCRACNSYIEFTHTRVVRLEDGSKKEIEEDLCNRCVKASSSMYPDSGEHPHTNHVQYAHMGNGNYVTRNIKVE